MQFTMKYTDLLYLLFIHQSFPVTSPAGDNEKLGDPRRYPMNGADCRLQGTSRPDRMTSAK
jgi:hypothetical protein